jgi:hypothetical protein
MMHDYIATIRVQGALIKTVVQADCSVHARLLLQYQYGWNSIVTSPRLLENITLKTPEQQRIDSLKATKDRSADALAAERQRQKISKAQRALITARKPINTKPIVS